jgi:tripartite-type tricarboxylate transporter receptor subunit TctC
VRFVREGATSKGQDRRVAGASSRRRTAAIRCLQAIAVVLATALGVGGAPVAQAAYPERPIYVVVPFAPGGPTDIIARILSNALSRKFGQQVIVDNRGGAGGNIGMAQVARAAPDGYTLLMASTAIAVNTALFKTLPYDPLKDFEPISELVSAPNVLVVRPDSDIGTVADLVAQAKANPARFNYSSSGIGTKSHLTGELLKLRAGIQMVHVPFRGAGPAAQAVIENTTQVGSVALGAAETLIRDRKLHALAVTSAKRWFSLPTAPTMMEAGYPSFISDTFNALFAPAGTPPDILAVLVRESRAAFLHPEAREQAHSAGFEIVAGTPVELSARVKAEIPAVRALVEKAGIKPE